MCSSGCENESREAVEWKFAERANVDEAVNNYWLRFFVISFLLPWNTVMFQHLIIQFSLYYLSSGRLWEVKNKRKYFKLLPVKVVTVAYERWSLTRSFKCSDLTWKFLVFWKTGRWGEVIAYEKCITDWEEWSRITKCLHEKTSMYFKAEQTRQSCSGPNCVECHLHKTLTLVDSFTQQNISL